MRSIPDSVGAEGRFRDVRKVALRKSAHNKFLFIVFRVDDVWIST